MAKSIDPGEPCYENMYAPTPDAVAAAASMKKLPLYLLDALRAFEADGDLQASLGDEFSQAFLKLKCATPREPIDMSRCRVPVLTGAALQYAVR